MALAGHPIIGDTLHGNREGGDADSGGDDVGRGGEGSEGGDGGDGGEESGASGLGTRLCLHASVLLIRHPESGQPLKLVAPPQF